MSLIEKLTSEQEALIPVYRDKWRAIALSTERINRAKAAEVVESLYSLLEKKVPEIIFSNSPNATISEMLLFNSSQNRLESNLVDSVEDYVKIQLQNFSIQVSLQPSASFYEKHLLAYNDNLETDFFGEDPFNLLHIIFGLNQSEIVWQLWSKKVEAKAISSLGWLYTAAIFDFLISEINCKCNHTIYKLVEEVVILGGMIFPFERFCLICDRPKKLSFDNQNRLHAEGEPAIKYADGFSLYSYHGVTLPEKYGKIHPQQWQAEWLLSEENTELRRVLIEGIGYAIICEELQAIELDNWQEYTLLKIDNNVDIEPIYLLKMACPSTGFIHALRVPPNINSAREAIRWVNWGVDPEEFGVQT
ncbi:DUF6745 domain-containing protein [Nostoc sp. CALU 1950]|uniref:DUF6745 domain-containing protein n=1 Tax=Nostoc sp. CALU 1950 TaxID=3104321 RepID=UPI003EB974D1